LISDLLNFDPLQQGETLEPLCGFTKSVCGPKFTPMTQLWCNGQWFDFKDFPGSPLDRGATHGLGLFETILALDGAPVFMERHLARLRKSMARLNWEITLPNLGVIAAELIERNQLDSGRARIRLAISAGSGLLNHSSLGSDHLVWMTAFPAPDVPPSVSVCMAPWPRNERSPLAGLKCASYAENLIALNHARQQGFGETIFLNTQGHLCEAAMGNLFLVKNGILQTPSLASGCLPGVTREVILELASRHDMAHEERALHLDDFHAADEIFITSATRGPVEVRNEAGNADAGEYTAEIRRLWDEETRL
jgi:branched-chain amino acid aminotransferase